MRIIDKINALLEEDKERCEVAAQQGKEVKPKTWYSFEYFPPKTPAGEENLIDRVARMAQTNPLWVDMTWGAGGGTFDSTLDLCGHMVNYMGLDVLMHITCTGLTVDRVREALDRAKELNIRNLLALRGDPPRGHETWEAVENGFHHASDLVRWIKQNYGDYFCIVVAGYPEVHSQATSREDDIKHLKEKVDAGADIIITQLFYNNDIYIQWVKDCRAAGINAHFIPGLMPILGYDRFQRTIQFCQTNVPQKLADALEPIKHDDEKVKEYGIVQAVEQCQELIDNGTRFLHFYTMNLEAAIIKTIKGLGILKDRKALPHAMTSAGRKGEEVRPIFWSNKPSSYLQKTHNWDEYPNGRWGLSRSPAFDNGDGFVSYSKKFKVVNQEEKLKLWGATCTSLEDVSKVFVSFVTGKIKKLPFSEGTMAAESEDINETLVQLNSNKLFTINSQPRVNGAKSTDSKFGWGPDNGYVYQKAYFELFVHPSILKSLLTYLEQFPDVTFQAMNLAGEKHQNVGDEDVNAVTWGVFKGKEIVQPTVVDHQAFEIWKNEALKSFVDTWSVIYKGEKGADAASVEFLEKCQNELYLVNIVHNDFVEGDLNKIMLDFITQNQDAIKTL